MKIRSDEISWWKKKCEYCKKGAVGYQGFGFCSPYVSPDHIDTLDLVLKPDEELNSFECNFERLITMMITRLRGSVLPYDYSSYC